MKTTLRTTLATTSALLLTLGAGMNAQAQQPPPPPPFRGGPGGPGGPGGNPLADLIHQLELTADEKTAVQSTLDAANTQIKAIQLDSLTRTDAVITAAAGQIRPLLTADQQAELDVFLKRLAKQLAKAQAAAAK